jgi:type IV pilus assembly protein PilX
MIMSLIILMVMTLLAISTMGAATLEEKMAGNANDRAIAFQAAETGLRTGETWLGGLTQLPTANATATGGVYSLSNIPATWWTAAPPALPPPVAANTVVEAGQQPRYVIEERAFIQGASLVVGGSLPPPGYTIYAVDARGTGGSNTAAVILQSTFAVPD